MKLVLITESQANLIGDYIQTNFIIRKFNGYIKNTINEDRLNKTMLPHKRLAFMLARGYRYADGIKVDCDRLSCSSMHELKKENSGFGVSYYFDIPFIVDGIERVGKLRISDHEAVPQTFANYDVDYALSIVFTNGTSNKSSNCDAVNVWEYISDSTSPEEVRNELFKLTKSLLTMLNVEVVNDKVIKPSEIAFKKVNKNEYKQTNYIFVTSGRLSKTDGRVLDFVEQGASNNSRKEIEAIQTKNGFKLLDKYKSLFNIGDKLTYYSFTGRCKEPQQYNTETITD